MSVESLIAVLRVGVHHATNLSKARQIRASGVIRNNDGTLESSYEQSSLSNCFNLKAISLFDFETPSDEIIYDRINRIKWEDVLFRHRPAIIFGIRRNNLPGELIEYAEAKRRCGLGGIIPSTEVCHIGAIPISVVFQTIVATRCSVAPFETAYNFQRYDGFQIPDVE
jgi:hypothetical protein